MLFIEGEYMRCLKCGFDNSDNCLFCINCGAKLPKEKESGGTENCSDKKTAASLSETENCEAVSIESDGESSKPYATAGMVCGIVSIAISFICCCEVLLFPFAFSMGIIGLIFSITALKKSKEYKSMAVCGVICSAIGLIISFIFFISAFVLLSYVKDFTAEQIKEYLERFTE